MEIAGCTEPTALWLAACYAPLPGNCEGLNKDESACKNGTQGGQKYCFKHRSLSSTGVHEPAFSFTNTTGVLVAFQNGRLTLRVAIASLMAGRPLLATESVVPLRSAFTDLELVLENPGLEHHPYKVELYAAKPENLQIVPTTVYEASRRAHHPEGRRITWTADGVYDSPFVLASDVVLAKLDKLLPLGLRSRSMALTWLVEHLDEDGFFEHVATRSVGPVQVRGVVETSSEHAK